MVWRLNWPRHCPSDLFVCPCRATGARGKEGITLYPLSELGSAMGGNWWPILTLNYVLKVSCLLGSVCFSINIIRFKLTFRGFSNFVRLRILSSCLSSRLPRGGICSLTPHICSVFRNLSTTRWSPSHQQTRKGYSMPSLFQSVRFYLVVGTISLNSESQP